MFLELLLISDFFSSFGRVCQIIYQQNKTTAKNKYKCLEIGFNNVVLFL